MDGPCQGLAALGKRLSLGAPHKFTLHQRAGLPQFVSWGVPSFGYCGGVWTAAPVAAIIGHRWQVHCHTSHVARRLHACGWSRCWKPARRARQRGGVSVQGGQQGSSPSTRHTAQKFVGCKVTQHSNLLL